MFMKSIRVSSNSTDVYGSIDICGKSNKFGRMAIWNVDEICQKKEFKKSFFFLFFHLDVLDAEAAVDDLSLGDGHVVVVHLLVAHLPVDVAFRSIWKLIENTLAK